jgi:hypothetical protein
VSVFNCDWPVLLLTLLFLMACVSATPHLLLLLLLLLSLHVSMKLAVCAGLCT